jgi:phage recombination protein Bet
MSNQLAIATNPDWTGAQVALIQQQIAPGCTVPELELFGQVCKRTGLDPFSRQIYAVSRGSGDRRKMTIQVSIDGFRLQAERSKKYAGSETFWCGEDGQWKDVWLSSEPPAAAKTVVWRLGCEKPFTGVALWNEYKQEVPVWKGNQKVGMKLGDMWAKMPATLLAKCFDDGTEVLTTEGFQKFSAITGRVLQVGSTGLEATHAKPFVQDYTGKMISVSSDMLNFCVTPNHDMVTTFGRVEAQAMLATSRTRPVWRIPMTVEESLTDDTLISDDDLRLAGYILADGWSNGHKKFNVAVSKPRKIESLRKLNPNSERVQHSKGAISKGERKVKSNFDKVVFTFDVERVSWLMDTNKVVDVGGISRLSKRQARIVIDAWQEFDGYTNKKTGVRRLYTSRVDHVRCAEILAISAGYSVNVPRERTSDISSKPNFMLTISEPNPAPVCLPVGNQPGIRYTSAPNENKVWCVTVPSGVIVVRRHGFSMLCGNCSEALALRKAYPAELSGLYTSEEMAQADLVQPIAPADEKAVEVSMARPVKQVAAIPAFLQEPGPSQEDKAIADKVNAAPPKKAKPEPASTEEQDLFSARLAENQIDDDTATAALSRLMKVSLTHWRALKGKQLAYTLGEGWDKFSATVVDIANESEAA